ncbi:hypothetical protein [Acinetobacter baumannii]|uniref:hypothetical protein n=1 Tax=Acinetobacter baumannii TaxID=470 RepID=UPI003AF47362
MKPEQFIREFGVEKAREALTLCCWMDGSFCTRLWHGCVQNNHECCVDVKDLKRLVESLDLIEKEGGYEFTNQLLAWGGSKISDEYGNRLCLAIKDHESIYGGGDE